MAFRRFTTQFLLLAIAGLLLAVGSAATAGSYSPRHLRAEGFLKLRTLDDGYEPGLRRSQARDHVQLRLGFQYPLNIGKGAMVMRVGARTKLRQLVRIEVLF